MSVSKSKTAKPKTVTETGWAVWQIYNGKMIVCGEVYKTKKLALRIFFTSTTYIIDDGVFINRSNFKAFGYRCLRTTAKGVL